MVGILQALLLMISVDEFWVSTARSLSDLAQEEGLTEINTQTMTEFLRRYILISCDYAHLQGGVGQCQVFAGKFGSGTFAL